MGDATDEQPTNGDPTDTPTDAPTDAPTNGEAPAEDLGPESAPGYGAGLDVEAVLSEHADSYPPELIEAQATKPDADQEVDISTITTKDDGDKVVATSKRGDYVIYVAKDADGVYYKGVVNAETGEPPPKAEAAPAAEAEAESTE